MGLNSEYGTLFPAQLHQQKSTHEGVKLRGSQRLTVQEITFNKAADALAATTTSDAVFVAARDGRLLKAVYIPHATLTADATDYATVSVKISTTTLASLTTELVAGGGTGDWVDNTPEELTLGTSLTFDEDDVILLDIAKAASGVVVPAGVLQLTICDDD